MNRSILFAGLVTGLVGMTGAGHAAPGEIAVEPPAIAPASIGAPIVQHRLDVEMTVRNWVLCASQPSAERLVQAREENNTAAAAAFSRLTTERACGLFPEMQVILQKSLYETVLDSGEQASIYGALVNISGAWAAAYVIYGGMPEQ